MTREELEKRLDEAEKQNLSLLNEVKSLKIKSMKIKNEPEIPDMSDFKNGEELFFVGSSLEAVCNSSMNTDMFEMDFNAFHTTIYAEEFRRKCLIIVMMLHCKWYFDRDYEPDWDNPIEEKWTVGFSHATGKFMVYNWTAVDFGTIAFSSKEVAQKACDWLNSNGKGITR